MANLCSAIPTSNWLAANVKGPGRVLQPAYTAKPIGNSSKAWTIASTGCRAMGRITSIMLRRMRWKAESKILTGSGPLLPL